MKRLALVFAMSLCLQTILIASIAEKSYGPLTVDYAGLLSQHDVVYLSPPVKGYEGLIVGNGQAGARIWNPPDRLMIQVNHSAFWNDLNSPPVNVHGARIEIQAGLPLYDWKYLKNYEARMDLYQAETSIQSEGSMGTSQVKTFYSRPHQVMILEYQDSIREPTSRKILLERFGSQYFGRFRNRDQNPELNLSGTKTGISENELWVEQQLGKRKFVVLLSIQSDSRTPTLNILNKHQVIAHWPSNQVCKFTLFLAMAHSEETQEPLALARQRIQKAIKEKVQKIRQQHHKDWANEWQKSFIYLPENRYMENLWYLVMYQAIASNRGKYPPFFIDALWNWKRDVKAWPQLHLHWNMFSPNFPMFAAGRWNLLSAYFDWKERALPHAIKSAEENYGVKGAFFIDHANLTDGKQAHMGRMMKYNLTPGPQQAMEYYQYWQYTQDKEFLRDRALPFMRKVAEFYMNVLQKDEKGVYHFLRSAPYEFHGPHQFRDCLTDMAHIRWLLPALIEAEKSSESISKLSKKAEEILKNLPDFTLGQIHPDWLTEDENGQKIYANPFFRGEPYLESDFVYCIGHSTKHEKMVTHMEIAWDPESKYGVMCGAESVCAFPPPLVNSDASPARRNFTGKNKEKDIEMWQAMKNGLRTLRKYRKGQANRRFRDPTIAWTGHNLNLPAFARLGLTKNLKKALSIYIEKYQMYPIGLWCYWGWDDWKDSYRTRKGKDGSTIEFPQDPRILHSSTEPIGIFAVTVQDMLLNSSDGVIRVFPAYKEDAALGLYAVGGFFITSEQKDGKTLYVRIESNSGNPCVLSCPWMESDIEIKNEKTERQIKYKQIQDRIYFETQKNQSYIIKQKETQLKSWRLTDVPRCDTRIFGKVKLGKPRDF